MKKQTISLWSVMLSLLLLGLGVQSCNDGKTYGEQKAEEADAIKKFIAQRNFNIISEEQFALQNNTTKDNEYVFLKKTGVYMNVMQPGDGTAVLENGTYTILFRFVEIAVQKNETYGYQVGDTLAYNMHKYVDPSYYLQPDEAQITIAKNSISGTFASTAKLPAYHKKDTRNSIFSTAVPSGWLIPLRYIKPQRTDDSDKIARVRLIVPHSEGHLAATENVYACYYELTYNLGR